MTVAPKFSFRSAVVSSRGVLTSGEGATEFYHPILPTSLVATAGFLLVLNGWNLNRFLCDTTGYDGAVTSNVQLLQMRAPRESILPFTSWVGNGRVFRPGAKWRYRWLDSRTGQHSGLSPIPDVETNMGVETPAGGTTYLGQTAWFYVTTTGKPASADTIQLFANTTQEDEVWYLADEQPAPASSTVLLTDDNTDDELFTQLSVVTGNPSAIPAGPTWSEGVMTPQAKAWQHPGGRVFYFGLRRMGLFRNFNVTAAVTQGSDLLTFNASTTAYQQIVEPSRIGQRVRFFNSASLVDQYVDPTVYRIIKIESANTVRVWPEIAVSTTLAAGASGTLYFQIEDDRDARWTQMSEPNKPWLIDPLKILAAGDDVNDGVLHWFSTAGRIFVQTQRRIYEAQGAFSDNPASSTLFIPVADEGTVGLWSGTETPFGWVYWHESRGARVFDGQFCRPLSRENDIFGEFKPATQAAGFESSMLEEVRAVYDGENRTVLFGYVPTGQSVLKEVLSFSTAERNWRGPLRECVSISGFLRSTTGQRVLVLGGNFGDLVVREAQALDTTPTLSGFAGTGSITTVSTNRVFIDAAAAFNGDSDERLRGSPIWFTNAAGTALYFARIVDVLSSTQLELDGPPTDENGVVATLTVGWTYSIGAIRWTARTAYVDFDDDPEKPVEFYYVHTRFKLGTAADTYEVGAAADGGTSFVGEWTVGTNASAPTADVNGAVKGVHRVKCEGSLAQFQFQGLARNGGPRITRAVVVAEEREGALP